MKKYNKEKIYIFSAQYSFSSFSTFHFLRTDISRSLAWSFLMRDKNKNLPKKAYLLLFSFWTCAQKSRRRIKNLFMLLLFFFVSLQVICYVFFSFLQFLKIVEKNWILDKSFELSCDSQTIILENKDLMSGQDCNQ